MAKTTDKRGTTSSPQGRRGRLPLDVRGLTRSEKPAQSDTVRDVTVRMAIDQTVSCYRVAGPTGVGLLLLAIWILLLARPAPEWAFAWFPVAIILGLLFITAWYVIQRVVISRSDHNLWRGLILTLALFSALAWSA